MKPNALSLNSMAVIVLAVVTAGSAQGADSRVAKPTPTTSPTVYRPVESPAGAPEALVVSGASPELERRTQDALERFASAGLTLPPLDIAFHDGNWGCDGHRGLFRSVGGVADIEICTTTRHVILHELAHAWVAEHIDPETRAALTAYWSLETWNDQEVERGLRANERAADAVAFGLGDLPTSLTQSLVDYLCGYTLLTNRPHSAYSGACDGTAGATS